MYVIPPPFPTPILFGIASCPNACKEDEQEALGQVWLPVFKKYLEQNWAMWGVALFSTMSIVTTKVKKAKDDAKKDTSQK